MTRLTKIHDDVHVIATPHRFLGLALGTRMTVLRLADRSLTLYSPVAIDAPLAAEIAALGEVAHVIAPNVYHHTYAADAVSRYPKAKLHASRGLRKKRPDLRIDADFDETTKLGDGITPVRIRGSMMGETVLVHAPSETVVSADLVENFVAPASDLLTRVYLRAAGIENRVGWSRLLKMVYRDKREARRSLDELLAHRWDRAIVAHGEVIERGANESVREALSWIR
jgi:hypothetical protein